MDKLIVFANIEGGMLNFIITGVKDDGEAIESPIGNRDISEIKDQQDRWFLGLAWLCDAVPRTGEIIISDKTIVDILSTEPIEAGISKVLGTKENYKIARAFTKGRKITYIERKDNKAIKTNEKPIIYTPDDEPDEVLADVPEQKAEEKKPAPKKPAVPKVKKDKES